MTIHTSIHWALPDERRTKVTLGMEKMLLRPSPDASDVVYLFLDEAGNFDFTEKGTRYFIMTCVVARRPLALNDPLTDLRYDLIERGFSLEKLHASEDRPAVREEVYGRIVERAESISAYSAMVDKRELPKELRREDVLYAGVFEQLTNEIAAREVDERTKMVVVTTDSLPKQAKRRHVEKPLKDYMKRHFQERGIPYMLMHHQSCSSVYLQVADYLCWAVHRQYAHGFDWPMADVEGCFRAIGQISYIDYIETDGPQGEPSA